jgi:hypothetical protein
MARPSPPRCPARDWIKLCAPVAAWLDPRLADPGIYDTGAERDDLVLDPENRPLTLPFAPQSGRVGGMPQLGADPRLGEHEPRLAVQIAVEQHSGECAKLGLRKRAERGQYVLFERTRPYAVAQIDEPI